MTGRGRSERPRPAEAEVTLDLGSARRLVLARQRLAGGPTVLGGTEGILSVIRDLGYVQWDPVNIVGPSHLISFWARLDGFRANDLERLLWKERSVFEHWTPMASLVLTEDYPLYASLMRRYPDSLTSSWGRQRDEAKRFLAAHADLRRALRRELRRGPRTLGDFEDHERTKRDAGDWAPSSDVSEMLFHLTMMGEVMVVGHQGAQNLWGLADAFLPEGVDRSAVDTEEFEERAAERAVRALGVASAPEITFYFVRGRYHDLPGALRRLEEAGTLRRARVEGVDDRRPRYVHREDVRLLDSVRDEERPARTTLVPPFDNLLAGKDRLQRLFAFSYVREQFLPAEKRRFGTYVLPIVHGERIIGRVDPRVDRAAKTLVVQAVHAEPDAPKEREVGVEIAETIARLGSFLGVDGVTYSSKVPGAWKSALR